MFLSIFYFLFDRPFQLQFGLLPNSPFSTTIPWIRINLKIGITHGNENRLKQNANRKSFQRGGRHKLRVICRRKILGIGGRRRRSRAILARIWTCTCETSIRKGLMTRCKFWNVLLSWKILSFLKFASNIYLFTRKLLNYWFF